jgi:hypothetical protein
MFTQELPTISMEMRASLREVIDNYSDRSPLADDKINKAKMSYLALLVETDPTLFREDFDVASIGVCPSGKDDDDKYVGVRFMLRNNHDITKWLHSSVAPRTSIQAYANTETGENFIVHLAGYKANGSMQIHVDAPCDMMWGMYDMLFSDNPIGMFIPELAGFGSDGEGSEGDEEREFEVVGVDVAKLATMVGNTSLND